MIKMISLIAVICVAAALTIAVWVYRFSGPSLRLTRDAEGIEVANVFLGEYYLGFDEVQVIEAGSGTVLFHATRGAGCALDEVRLVPGVNAAKQVHAAGWSVVQAAGDLVPQLGHTYRITVRGNNGFGYSNRRSLTVLLGANGSHGVSNNGVNLPVWPVTRLAVSAPRPHTPYGRAQVARPSQPAGYAGRSTHKIRIGETLLKDRLR